MAFIGLSLQPELLRFPVDRQVKEEQKKQELETAIVKITQKRKKMRP